MMIDLIHAGPPMATAFLASSVEAVEAATVVLAAGVVRGWRSSLSGAAAALAAPATLGAIAACVAVAVAAALLNRPLSRVPENALKFAVGVMVSAFGLFWFGEGIGVHWPYGDAAILALMAVLLAAASIGIRAARRAAFA